MATIVIHTICALSASAQNDPVGYQALLASFSAAGLSAPGTGVVVQQVEAPESGSYGSYAYMPDKTLSQFSGVTISDYSSDGGLVSTHATTVAGIFYGTYGYASGVSQVDVYETNDWLGNVLKVGRMAAPAVAPLNHPAVADFSWVSQNDSSNVAYNNDALRRFDYMINRDNLVAVVAVNNNTGTAIPALLASSYNSISVGLSSGSSSTGPVPASSGVDGPGRSKPDIVAPQNATSYATPEVSAAAAMLVQVARSKTALSSGTNAAVVKSILLAGADKTPLSTWSHTSTQSLDLQYGAGQLNFNWAYQIMAAGPQTAGSTSLAASTGWSYSSLSPSNSAGNTKTYFFQVPSGQPFDLSALLTWQRNVTYQAGNPAVFTPTLATIDLNLYHANSNFTLGSLVDSSSSSIDNVQYVFDRGLPPGEYALQVTRADSIVGNWNYALSWQMQAVPYWIAANGSWNNPANWNNDLVAGGIGREAALFAPTTTGVNVTLDAPQIVGLLTLSNTASSTTGYTINAGSAGSLTFNNSGISSQLNVTSGSHVISAPVILASNLIVAPAAGTVLGVSGNISGSGALTETGSGMLILTGSNTYGGTTTINAGTLQVGAGGTLGPAPVVDNSTLLVNRPDAFTVPNSISGIGVLTQDGTGTVTLAGTNSYSGGTRVNAGNIVFSSSNSIPSSGSILLNGPGALNVTGAYSTVTGWLSSGKINTASNGALALSGTSSENINMGSYSQLALGAASSGATYNGFLTQSGSATYDGLLTPSGSMYRLGGGGGVLTVASNLTGTNGLVVGSAGPGAVILSGSNNYTGGTLVTNGTLEILHPWSLPDGGSLTVGNPAMFQAPVVPSLVLSGALGAASNDAVSLSPSVGDFAASPVVAQPAVSAVPEPNAWLLICASAGCGLVSRGWRRYSSR